MTPPSSPGSENLQPFSVKGSLNSNDDNIESEKDRVISSLKAEIKQLQKQNSQLCSESAAKDKIFQQLQKAQKIDGEDSLAQYKATSEVKAANYEKVIKTQDDQLKSQSQTIKDLHAKLRRVYSGEEERNRIQLEKDKQELLESNKQLKLASETQRKRRKQAERDIKLAQLQAEDALQARLKEAENEVETLKKMLETETENSKALIAQLSQVRASNGQRNGTLGNQQAGSTALSTRSDGSLNESIEDLKARASIIGDFTGFEILSMTKDKKGNIYDCIVADITGRGLALNFKLQYHSDNTCSYFPALDQERDAETIEILPGFLREFVFFRYFIDRWADQAT
ncbi:hypothetical protein O181_069582 [Austropuccinia psidii MF-1]|uniref:Monopolin complex subunit Csm1/Pcs1 C-terminal domain-containing protein n=1 Tax=Austropuccinia psidii MF-1 TaxID=1389203 RepID=A0A9Q3F1K4_9BASI|nr:hypothetical protein [Austropuccinia psidii MF-1]